MAEMPFPAKKKRKLEAKNVPAHCHGEKLMSHLYTTLLSCALWHQ
jgi:hypothetical protein